jgi:hypothetical protein
LNSALGPIFDHPETRCISFRPIIDFNDLLEETQVRVTPASDLMINVQRAEGGTAIHVIRYDFDAELDRTPPLPELTIELRLTERYGRLSVHSPGTGPTGTLERDEHMHRIRLRDVPLYSVALLEPG